MDGKENTDVQAAFELLNNTLDEERKRIFAAGSQAMDRQDAEVAQGVLDFVKKLDAFRQDVQSMMARWAELQAANDIAPQKVQEIVAGDGKLFTSARKHKTGYTRKLEHAPAPKSGFIVTFPDGKVIAEKKAADCFVQAIGQIGCRHLLPLKLVLNGEPLIAEEPSSKYKSAWRKTADGFYVSTHSSTESKAKCLALISKRLNLGLKVELTPGLSKEN